MWNSEIDATYTNVVEKETKVVNDNLPIILDRTPAAVLQLAGASQQIATSKYAVQNAIDTIRRKTGEIAGKVDEITNHTSSTRNAIEAKRQEVEQLKKTVSQSEVLDSIRKEQVLALKEKTEGSRHSSWMGLWRPLAKESRTGLFVASIAFALIAIVSIVYIVWDKFGIPATTPRDTYAYIGGFLKQFPIRVSKL
jgi:hypothetical protein